MELFTEQEKEKRELKRILKFWQKEARSKKSKFSDFWIYKNINEIKEKLRG